MSQILRRLLSVYMDEENGGEGGGGGGATSEGTTDDEATAEDKKEKESKISDSEAKLLKEVMDKKNALNKVKQELAEKEALLKKIEELGGVDSLAALAIEKKTAEQKKLEERGEWDRVKAQMNEEHGKVLSAKDQAIADKIAENEALNNMIADLTVGNSFQSSNFVKESLVIPAVHARKIYGSHFEFQDGKIVGFDKPAGSADRTVLVDGQGDPLSFDAAMQKIIDADPERDSLLKSKIKSGAGSSTTTKTKAPPTNLDKPQGQDRIAAALAKGLLTK